ncbi:MAG: 2-dehydropantoate 2-reductase [Bacteroidetes bacterium]|nr:2-dehydropantoate 2-reductase [Bacteroidota bacterium]
MKFVVVGTGGVGGYFGGKLATSGPDVWFIARGEHLAAMRRNGLTINSDDGTFQIPPGKMTDDPRSVGPAEVILFCVKSYDTEAAARTLAPMLTKDSVIISLQNGVDNEERIQRAIPTGTVYGGATYIYSTLTEPGVINQTGRLKKIVFGPMQAGDGRGKPILDTLVAAGINAELTDDIQSALWTKFIFIAAVGGVTALTRHTLGEILATESERTMLEQAMRETEAVAKALQVNIPPGIINKMFETLRAMNNDTYSSMYHDLVNGKPLEIEAFSGTVIRHGEALGIPTPTHRAIYTGLMPFHLKHSQNR